MGEMVVKITKKAREMARARQVIIPKLIGNEVVNFALDNFQRQGYLGDTFQPWRKRKSIKGRDATRALLVKSGKGRRSIRVKMANENQVVVGSEFPYMKAHNEGSTALVTVKEHSRKLYGKTKVGTGTFSIKSKKERMRTVSFLSGHTKVKQHTRRMRLPKRQFLGKSQYLMARLKRIYISEINKAWNA